MQIATVKINNNQEFVNLLDILREVVSDFQWNSSGTYLLQNRGAGNIILVEAEEKPTDLGEGLLLCSYKAAIYKPTNGNVFVFSPISKGLLNVSEV